MAARELWDALVVQLFVSSGSVGSPETDEVILRLRDAGYTVAHSPQHDCHDNWYSELPAAVAASDVAVVVVDALYDSSWMGVEGDEILRQLRNGNLSALFVLNWDQRSPPTGLSPYVEGRETFVSVSELLARLRTL